MNGEGRDSDDADWLLAQLANGGQASEEPPVAPAPEPAEPAAGGATAAPVVPRREESLDWFSLAESAVPPSPLTSVEPPVGPQPSAKEVPPGPVTPASPFALSWSDDRSLDSEDAIRAAFRNLSQPGEQPAPPAAPPSSPEAGRPAPTAEPDPLAAPPVVPPSPFAGYTAPPVARQTFTPVGGNPIVPPPPQAEPPRHPIAPTTAPAGWDERRSTARAVEPAAAPTPAQSAVGPQAASGRSDDVDHELWSALVEPEPQESAPTARAASAESSSAAPAPAPLPSSDEPSAVPVRARFRAFGASTTPTPSGESERPVAPQPHVESGGFPFLEVRGDAGSESASVGATAAGSAVGRRSPFPAFASADDRERPEPQPSEHVDDLLAALGGRSPAPSTPQPTVPGTPTASGGASVGGGTPPPRDDDGLGALGIDVDDDSEAGDPDVETDHEAFSDAEQPESPIAREIAETGYFWNLTPDPSAPDPKADAGPVGLERPSPYATAAWPPAGAEAASAGDPVLGPDDERQSDATDATFSTDAADADDADAITADEGEAAAAATAWPFGGADEPAAPAADDEHERVAGDPSPSLLFPAAAGAEDEPPAAAPTGPMTDAIAALFGGAPATQAASAPAAASAAGSAGAAASPFAASAAATGAAFATTPAATSPAATKPAAEPAAGPSAARSGGSGGGSRAGGGGGGNDRRTLLWIAGGLVVLVVLAGLFYLGTRLAPAGGGDAASGSPDATTASEAPVPEPTAAQPPGVHAWNTLFGGECLGSFPSAWENEYTVVDCAAPHAAQLVHRGELAGDAAAPFPGEEALAAQMADLCRADGIIDPALITGINDLQVAASYPVESQWAEGERTFYCFANRSSGEPLTGSITGPGPAA